MAMGHFRFRFAQRPDEVAWRAQLRREVGRNLSSERCVEIAWEETPGSEGGALVVCSMNGIALIYGAKVCLAFGGERVARDDEPWALPAWTTASTWRGLPWMKRARLWFGPTSLNGAAQEKT